MRKKQVETAVSYDDRGIAYFSSDERKWITKMRKLAEKYPEECQITVQPEGNDGCINAKFPAKWVKVSPPRQINMTDEKRAELSERMLKLREELGNCENEEEIEEDETEGEDEDCLFGDGY